MVTNEFYVIVGSVQLCYMKFPYQRYGVTQLIKLNKFLTTSDVNYSKFSDRDVREDILGLTLYLAERINAFALYNNIRRICDVAERRKNSM